MWKATNTLVKAIYIASVVTAALGLRESSMHSTLLSGANDHCPGIQAIIREMLEHFPACAEDVCTGVLPTFTPVTTSAPTTTGGVGGATLPTAPPTMQPTSTTTTTRTTQGTTVSTAAPPPTGSSSEVQVGTYIPNWFVYRKHYMGIPRFGTTGGVPVRPEDGDNKYVFWGKNLEGIASKLTHIYYAFWNLSEDCHVEDSDPDASWYGANAPPTWITPPTGACQGLMNDLMALKTRYPHFKLLVSLGGWTYSKNFPHCCETQQNIHTFYKTTAFRLNEMDPNWGKANGIWDGVDFDWEFPESPSGLFPDHTDTDWINYVTLINYFRSSAHSEGRTKIVLASAIGVGETLDRLVARPAVTKGFCDALEHVNLMTYDIHGKWDPTTGHNAQFCIDTRAGNPSPPISVQSAIDKFHKGGCDMKKIHLGLPNYAPAWTLIEPGQHNNGLFVTASNPNYDRYVGWSTFSDSDSDLIPQGLISYWDLKQNLVEYPDFQVHSWNCPVSHGITVPIKHVYSATRKAFATYDDPEVISKKVQWAKAAGLGGFFFWDVQQDKYADLLDAAREGWGGLPTHPATGTYTCYDHRKPNFNLDPFTGLPIEKLCQLTNRSITFSNGLSSCNDLRAETQRICGGESMAIGGQRADGGDCLILCSPNFGPGDVGPWANDLIYYRCDGEPLAPAPPGSGASGGGTGGGGGSAHSVDCKNCDACTSVVGNPQGATNADCAPCARGQQGWWPCTSGTQLCHCA